MTNDKYVLITGINSGIGKACSEVFSSNGYKVIGFDINESSLDNVYKIDIRSENDIINFFNNINDEIQILDLVHCAGIAITSPIHEMNSEDWNNTININLSGFFNVSKHMLKYFLRNNIKGNITVISSDGGIKGTSNYGAYCASKHGVLGLMKCIALEYGKNEIQCNAICPGFVQTPMLEKLFMNISDSEKQKFYDEIPLRRFAKAQEVAEVCWSLSSTQSKYTTGLSYILDGGVLAGHL